MPQHIIGYKQRNIFNEFRAVHIAADQLYNDIFLPVLRTAGRAATGLTAVNFRWDRGPLRLYEIGSDVPIEVPEGVTAYGVDDTVMSEGQANTTGMAVAESWQEFIDGEQHHRRFPTGFTIGRFAVDLTQLQA